MDSTTQRDDDELSQQAPLVPDIGRSDGDRTPAAPSIRRSRRSGPGSTVPDDELAQEAPLVPHLGRIDALRETTDDDSDNR